MSCVNGNLKPWPKGVSGNPGGRPKRTLISEELERILEQVGPNADGETWAALIARALLYEASRGNVKAISELMNRIEGKPQQSVSLSTETSLASRLEAARRRVIRGMTKDEIEAKIRELEAELGYK